MGRLFSALIPFLALLSACGASDPCDPDEFEPVDVTISGGDSAHRSLLTSGCVFVTSTDVDSVCEARTRQCVTVRDGEVVRIWFPAEGRCDSDGVIRDADDPNGDGMGLVYSYDECE